MDSERTKARKVFAGITLFALAGIAIFGGVFAWRTSDSARGAALVGSNGFEIQYEAICDAANGDAVVDPDTGDVLICLTLVGHNGTTTQVGSGKSLNNGDFDLVIVGGSLEVRHVIGPIDPVPVDPDEAAANPDLLIPCSVDHFSGELVLASPGEVIPPGGTGGPFSAFLTVHDDAPPTCQGNIAIYKVSVVAENPSDPIPEPAPVEPVS